MKGKVVWYDFEKHFGFAKGEDDKDYFFHRSFLPDPEMDVESHTEIEFEPKTVYQAQNIKIIENAKGKEN